MNAHGYSALNLLRILFCYNIRELRGFLCLLSKAPRIPDWTRDERNSVGPHKSPQLPAKAGIHGLNLPAVLIAKTFPWTPAFAGVTGNKDRHPWRLAEGIEILPSRHRYREDRPRADMGTTPDLCQTSPH